MILITQNLQAEYLRANNKYKLDEVINLKKFTVSQTPLSYRQANDLDENKLLDNNRHNKAGWRKFSYKELVYIEILSTLREFGVKSEQLKSLWEAFFKEPSKVAETKGLELVNKRVGEIAIGCVFAGIEMTIIFDSKGNILFSDPSHLLLSFATKPQIKFSLNDIVNKLNPMIGLESIPVQYTLQNAIINNFSVITPKENELLKIIRNKDYSAVEVKKKNGEIGIVYAEMNNSQSKMSQQQLTKLLKSKDYMNISILKRDGKIVSYRAEETIKL